MTLSRRTALTLIATAVTLPAMPAAAAKPPVFSTRKGAIRGYDPVAYFTQNAAVKGASDITSTHEGAVFHFATPENKAAFDANPAKFAPQYGGYCAWAVSQGYTASIDPEAFDIRGGKLYLNYSKRIQRKWLGDVAGNIAKGDANWPNVLK